MAFEYGLCASDWATGQAVSSSLTLTLSHGERGPIVHLVTFIAVFSLSLWEGGLIVHIVTFSVVFSLSLWEGGLTVHLVTFSAVFSLSLWERAGVRGFPSQT